MAHEGKSVADKKKRDIYENIVSFLTFFSHHGDVKKNQKPLTTSIKPLQLKKASKNAPLKKSQMRALHQLCSQKKAIHCRQWNTFKHIRKKSSPFTYARILPLQITFLSQIPFPHIRKNPSSTTILHSVNG